MSKPKSIDPHQQLKEEASSVLDDLIQLRREGNLLGLLAVARMPDDTFKHMASEGMGSQTVVGNLFISLVDIAVQGWHE